MKKFMAVFTGTAIAREKAERELTDEAARNARDRAGMEAWGKWVDANRDAIVDMGAPLGRTKRVDPDGISDTHNALAAYTVVQADSHEAAAKMFEKHPHFTIFPGDAVEVMECLPIPGAPT
ncbi:MAG TPA: hypothetical protein VIT90_03105 [Lysobacter sp.]